MNARHGISLLGGLLVSGLVIGNSPAPAQTPGVGERVGEKVGQTLDEVGRGARTGAEAVTEKVGQTLGGVGKGVRRETQAVGEAVRKRFDTVRGEVQVMGVASRVYCRLHWDAALHTSRIEVHQVRRGAVLLRGTVPDVAARDRAIALARDTVDVTEVIDELAPLSGSAAAPVPARRVR